MSARVTQVVLVAAGLAAAFALFTVALSKLGHWEPRAAGPIAVTSVTRSPALSRPSRVVAPAPAPSAPQRVRPVVQARHAAAAHGFITVGHVLLLLGASAALGALLVLLALVYTVRRRLRNRHARAYGLYELKLSMHDQARAKDLLDMVEALAGVVRALPARRMRDGQPFFAFEAHYGPGPDGELEWVLCVRCEPRVACMIDAALCGAYPDVRLGYEFVGPPRQIGGTIPVPGYVLRLRKERPFIYPISSDTDEAASSPLEALALAQAALGAPSTVRFQLTPCALALERFARERFRSRERELSHRESGLLGQGRAPIGTLDRSELGAAAEAQGHAWFFLEVQVAAGTRDEANRLAAALQARRGSNRLQRRLMFVREDLYRRRFPSAYPPLLPSLTLRTLHSAYEVAHLLCLPGARMKGVAVRRLALPRVPAPPEVCFCPRDPQPELPPTADGAAAAEALRR